MITPILTRSGGTQSPGYIGLTGHYNPSNTGETRKECSMPIACSFGGLYVKLTGGISAGKYLRITLRKNRADTALTIQINGPANVDDVFSNFTEPVDFAVGDTANWKTETDNASVAYNMFALIDADSAILTCHPVAVNQSVANSLVYWNIQGAQGTGDDGPTFNVRNKGIMPCAGTFSNLWVHFDDETTFGGGAGIIWRITLYVNDIATSLYAQFSNPNDRIVFNNTDSVAVLVGDTVRFKCTVQSGSAGALDSRYVNTSICFTPTIPDEVPLLSYDALPTDLDTNKDYGLPVGDMDFSKFSTTNGMIVPAVTVKNIIAKVDVAPGAGHWEDFFVAKNTVDTAIGGRISDTDLQVTDDGEVDFVCGDLFQLTRIADNTVAANPDNIYVSMTIVVNSSVLCPDIFDCTDAAYNNRFLLDYVADVQRPAQDVLNDMLATFAGFLVYAGSKVKLRVEKPELITQYFGDGSTTKTNASFDPNNIVKDSFAWNMSSIDDRPNRVRVQWIDPDQNYIKVYTQVEDRIDQDDRNTVITKDVSLLGITRASQAARMAKFIMGSAKYAAISVSFSARLESIHCEVGDVIAVTHQSARFTRKQFRITAMEEAEDETIRFTCKEYNPSLYDDKKGAGIIQMATPTFVNPYGTLDDAEDVSLSEEVVLLSGGTYGTNIHVSWTAIAPDQLLRLAYYLIQLSVDGGTTYVDVGAALASATSLTFGLTNASPGTLIMVKIRSLSNKGTSSAGDNTASLVLQGDITEPDDVTNFSGIFSVDKVMLSWTAVSDMDLFGYEIRVGNSSSVWSSAGILVTEYAGTTYNAFNLSPGLKKFFIKAIDQSGNYSTNAASVSIAVPIVAGASIVFEFDVFSRITQVSNPLEGTLSSELDKIATTDYDPTYYRTALQPKTETTFLEYQQAGGTFATLQASSFRFGREVFVTTQQSYETTAIDLSSSALRTFYLDTQGYSLTNEGVLAVQISTSTDGVTFSAYTGFLAGQYTARYVKFKYLITASASDVVVRLISSKLTATVP